MEIRLAEIDELLKEIRDVKALVLQPSLTKEWYTDEDCWRLKGGGSLATYRSNRYHQCKGGVPDGYVGGRKVWSKASVMEWLPLTDGEQLDAYHAKYRTGASRRRST